MVEYWNKIGFPGDWDMAVKLHKRKTEIFGDLIETGTSKRRILKLRAVPISSVLNFRSTTSQKCGAVPRRACM